MTVRSAVVTGTTVGCVGFNDLIGKLDHSASVQAAGISRGYSGPPARQVSVTSGLTRLRCASLLKPLYAWVSAPRTPEERWRAYAEPAVVMSSNTDTLGLWLGVGPRVILRDIGERTGVHWTLPNGDPSRFGSVEVTAAEVAAAYAVFGQAAAAGDPVAGEILGWMRQVPDSQTFGAREATRSPEAAVKCGWYGAPDETTLRTHAVALLPRGGTRVTVVVAMTALPYTDLGEREAYRSRVSTGLPVEDEHDKVAGEVLRGLMGVTAAELA